MGYHLSGQFVEACDCTVICPCWVDEDPVGGHCTGFIAWVLDKDAHIDDVDVSGCQVVSVSTHAGFRRDTSSTTTVLYVDVPDAGSEEDRRFEQLVNAFSGQGEGVLAELAEVSGTVADSQRARITVERHERNGGEPDGGWSVTVHPDPAPGSSAADGSEVLVVDAAGAPKIFDAEHGDEPLVLRHTALSRAGGGRQRGRGPAGRASARQRRRPAGRVPRRVGALGYARGLHVPPPAAELLRSERGHRPPG